MMKKVGRNDPCPCDSGKKFKQCCMRNAGVHATDPASDELAIAGTVQLAIAHHQAGRLDQAEAIYRQVLARVPKQPDALHLLGLIAQRTGRHALAVESIEKAIAACPGSPVPHNNLGTVFLDQGRLKEAETCFRQALALKPDYAEAFSNLANVLDALGRTQDAIAGYRKALALNPQFAEAHYNLANVLKGTGEIDEALAGYRRAIALRPDYADAYSNLGLVLHEQGLLDEALASYRAALEYRPDLAQVHFNLANALSVQGQLAEAAKEFRHALAARPDLPDAHRNLGVVLQRLGEHQEAMACLRRAIERKPEDADAHLALAEGFERSGALDEAISHCRKATEFSPTLAAAWGKLGLLVQQQGKLDEAVECFRQAVANKPDFAEAYNNLGLPLQLQGRAGEALASYRQALDVNPDYSEAHSNLLLTMQYMDCAPAERFSEHLRFAERFETPWRPSWPVHQNSRDPSRRLRVGYVSGDFRDHAVAYFIEPILAQHDRAEFELSCYYNHARHDAVSDRLAALADHWIRCWELSDDALADRIRGDGIDILVDLSGHTAYNRLPVFARKPAPIQMTWIGYPATTGLAAMDYRITEESLDPIGMTERYHTETLLRLPSGATFRPAAESPPVNDLPALTSDRFTLACLNNLVKVNARVMRLWSRILAELPHADLIVGASMDAPTRQRLLERVVAAGVPADRLILFPRLPLGDYLALHREIDLALDPFPYNGGTTSCHSLWMGVPMVTLAGSDTASRYGVALMQGLGLPEFVAASEDEYVARVVAFARDLPRLNHVRQTLRERIAANLSRDPVHLTRHLEAAYRTAWKTWCESAGV